MAFDNNVLCLHVLHVVEKILLLIPILPFLLLYFLGTTWCQKYGRPFEKGLKGALKERKKPTDIHKADGKHKRSWSHYTAVDQIHATVTAQSYACLFQNSLQWTSVPLTYSQVCVYRISALQCKPICDYSEVSSI